MADLFLTGASGFVGRALCRELLARGHHLRCLVRSGSQARLPDSDAVTPVNAELFDPAQIAPHLQGVDAVIHLVGIIREFPARQVTFARLHDDATRAVVEATEQAGVKRYLHMSANGTRNNAVSAYHQTKWQAEEYVRNSSLDWTIFRPSLIYGSEDQFVNMLVSLVRRLPVLPVPGDGDYRMQPVPVEQIAETFAKAIEVQSCIGKTYHCGGSDCLSYNEILDLVSMAIRGRARCKVHQPLSLMKPAVNLLQRLPIFPMTADQLQMLLEGNCCDAQEWWDDFALTPIAFEEGIRYLR